MDVSCDGGADELLLFFFTILSELLFRNRFSGLKVNRLKHQITLAEKNSLRLPLPLFF